MCDNRITIFREHISIGIAGNCPIHNSDIADVWTDDHSIQVRAFKIAKMNACRQSAASDP